MSRYTGPKARIVRREGLNVFGSEKYNLKKKNYRPGMHGPKGNVSKPSEYARQLREKQKLKFMYGVTERQMGNYFKKAAKAKDITGNALFKLLEYRLDNVLYRAGMGKTRNQTRQMVTHGLIRLNGRRVKTPSIHVKIGDKFDVIDRAKSSPLFADLEKQKFAPAKWVKVDYKALNGEVMRAIEPDELEQAISSSLIVEFYSK